MWIKIILIVLGIGLFLYGLYVMYESSKEVVESNQDVTNMGEELLSSKYPLGASIVVGGSIMAIISGYFLRKDLSHS